MRKSCISYMYPICVGRLTRKLNVPVIMRTNKVKSSAMQHVSTQFGPIKVRSGEKSPEQVDMNQICFESVSSLSGQAKLSANSHNH